MQKDQRGDHKIYVRSLNNNVCILVTMLIKGAAFKQISHIMSIHWAYKEEGWDTIYPPHSIYFIVAMLQRKMLEVHHAGAPRLLDFTNLYYWDFYQNCDCMVQRATQ